MAVFASIGNEIKFEEGLNNLLNTFNLSEECLSAWLYEKDIQPAFNAKIKSALRDSEQAASYARDASSIVEKLKDELDHDVRISIMQKIDQSVVFSENSESILTKLGKY